MAVFIFRNGTGVGLSGEVDVITEFKQFYCVVDNSSGNTVYVNNVNDLSSEKAHKIPAYSAGLVPVDSVNDRLFLLGNGDVFVYGFDGFDTAMVMVLQLTSKYGKNGDNLIVNPDFAINQRRREQYNGGSGYCVDRWFRNTEAIVSVAENGITMSYSGTKNPSVYQIIEQVKKILGKTLTLSARIDGKVYNCTGTMPEKITTSNTYIAFARLDGKKVTPESQSVPHIRIQVLASGNCLIVLNNVPNCEWAKLEFGGTATPFIPPEPATELIKCQRYYQIRSTNDVSEVDLRSSMASSPKISQLSDGSYAYSVE